jgi:hypothetical protein
VVANGTPSLANVSDITPSDTSTIVEPQDVSSDGNTFLLSANVNTSQYGWDSYAYNVSSGTFTNLTNSPTAWDEHARFSPDNKKIVWATSSPFAPLPGTMVYPQLINTVLRMEFFLMNSDGSGQTQLTHFNQSGYPEYAGQKTIANVPIWSYDGTQVLAGTEPTGLYLVTFRGPCGKQ